MIITAHCSKLDMSVRLLTKSHCVKRTTDDCASGKCDCFKTRLSCPVR
jgi:hypothetical protein